MKNNSNNNNIISAGGSLLVAIFVIINLNTFIVGQLATDVTDTVTGRSKVIGVNSGDLGVLNDAQYKTCTISGLSYVDYDNTGIPTDEKKRFHPLADAQLRACDSSNKCFEDISSTKTGNLSLRLEPGTNYYFIFTCPSSYYLSDGFPSEHCGGSGASKVFEQREGDPDRGIIGFRSASFHLASCQQPVTPLICGCYQHATIAGNVFEDIDKNGIQKDPIAERGIPRVEVRLARGDDSDYARTILTDANGYYAFDRLHPGGPFNVKFKLLDAELHNYEFSRPALNSDGEWISNDNTAQGIRRNEILLRLKGSYLRSGDKKIINQGLFQLATIKGIVWDDFNRNGIDDVNEKLLPGVKVQLYRVSGDASRDGAPLGETVSDSSGGYSFESLQPGDYYVKFFTATPKSKHSTIKQVTF